MKFRTLGILFLSLGVALLSFGCGGGEKTLEEPVSQTGGAMTEQKNDLSPAEIGKEVGGLYLKTMSQLVELLKDKPAVSDVRAKVEALKKDCVAQMVDFGKKREALDAAGRAAADAQISMKINSLYNDPSFAAFNDIQQYYFQDQDFHKLVIGFNIITQYANFDLLKKQEPEEARRLGIQ